MARYHSAPHAHALASGGVRLGCALGMGGAAQRHFDPVVDALGGSLRSLSGPEPASVADFFFKQLEQVTSMLTEQQRSPHAVEADSATALLGLGDIHFDKAELVRARRAYARAAHVCPNAVEPRVALARLHHHRGDVAAAWECVHAALALRAARSAGRSHAADDAAFDAAFHETVRQVYVHCAERGELLEAIRSQLTNRETILRARLASQADELERLRRWLAEGGEERL